MADTTTTPTKFKDVTTYTDITVLPNTEQLLTLILEQLKQINENTKK